jgi:hypothetical protein
LITAIEGIRELRNRLVQQQSDAAAGGCLTRGMPGSREATALRILTATHKWDPNVFVCALPDEFEIFCGPKQGAT